MHKSEPERIGGIVAPTLPRSGGLYPSRSDNDNQWNGTKGRNMGTRGDARKRIKMLGGHGGSPITGEVIVKATEPLIKPLNRETAPVVQPLVIYKARDHVGKGAGVEVPNLFGGEA